MNLIKLDLEYPTIFKKIEAKFKHYYENRKTYHDKKARSYLWNKSDYFTIAGGAPSDYYMGRDFRDIDIFITGQMDKKTLEAIFQVDVEVETFQQSTGYGNFIDKPYLYRMNLEGFDVEVIPSSPERILEFDIRLRQFYCYEGAIYANEKALSDIEQKKVVVTNPSTPISTLFRMFRFEENLNFEIDPRSLEFIKWGFNHKDKKVQSFYDYIAKRQAKLSDTVKKKLLHIIENNQEEREVTIYKEVDEPKTQSTETELSEWFDEDRRKIAKNERVPIIHFNEVTFPFHPSIEPLLSHEMRKSTYHVQVEFTMNYALFESFQPIDETFTIELEQQFIENKAKQVVKKINKDRVKAIVQGFDVPKAFPKKEDWEAYLDGTFLEKVNDSFLESFDLTLHNYTRGLQLFLGEATCQIRSLEFEPSNSMVFSLRDILSKNALILTVNDHLQYHLRKCSNGTYTISEIVRFTDYDLKGSGFYLEAVGNALKVSHPERFDFNNPDLKAVVGFSPDTFYNEYFFQLYHFKRDKVYFIESPILEKTVPLEQEMIDRIKAKNNEDKTAVS